MPASDSSGRQTAKDQKNPGRGSQERNKPQTQDIAGMARPHSC